MDTMLWKDGMSLSILRYRSISARVRLARSASSALCSDRTSDGSSSPRSGGAVDTLAQAAAEMMVQM